MIRNTKLYIYFFYVIIHITIGNYIKIINILKNINTFS